MNLNQTIISGMCIAFLSACGGGGDSSGATPQPQPQKFSMEDVQDVVETGFGLLEATSLDTTYLIGHLGGAIQSLAADAGGSRVLPRTCASGTGSAQVNKLTAHVGLTVGDELTLTYGKCSLNGALLDGTVRLTVRAAVSPSTTDINATYDASTTLFSITEGGVARTFSGVAAIRLTTAGSFNSVTSTLAVPAGQTFAFTRNGELRVEYQGGTSYFGTETSSPNSASRRLDGTVRIQDGTAAGTFSVKTPTVLAGTLASNGYLKPTSGVLEVTDVGANLSTSTTVSGINAQVSGDTDRNGSRDLSFTALVATLLP